MTISDAPSQIQLSTGPAPSSTVRLGKGDYKAFAVDNIVTLTASNISMSGLNPQAVFVHVPTFAPPLQYKLVVYETHRELLT